MTDLVDRLRSDQPAIAILRQESTAKGLRVALEHGLVHIKFVETRGGIEIGVEVDRDATDLGDPDFTSRAGCVRLVSGLLLDYGSCSFYEINTPQQSSGNWPS